MPLSTDPEYDDFFEPLNLDIEDLQKLDAVIENDYRRMGAASKSPSSSTFGRSLSGRRTIGGVLSPRSSSPKELNEPSSSCQGMPQRSPEHSTDRKVKKWDHTAFAKTLAKTGTKGKTKAIKLDEDAGEEDTVEFEQFPAPFAAGKLVT